jgi:phage terminase large subunit GpA-like protein
MGHPFVKRVLAVLAPPPDMTVSEWADEYRYLSAESSASPGKWRTSTVEYLREPMDMVGNPLVRRITLMTSAQVGKSSFIENVIGFFMGHDPCPILHVSPTISSSEMFSKERLAPMLRDCPSLRKLVKEAKSRDSGNTISTKTFPGGTLALVGANAPAGLASRPIRTVLCDEVDRFERSAGTEGDPINLAVKRTTTYWNRVLIFVSTPGNKGQSRIEEEYERGDMRQRWCACHACGAMQVLKWAQVKWDDRDPDTARYECEHCGEAWTDYRRVAAVRAGSWIAQKPFNGNVSYHLSQIYSPFAPLSDGVRDFLDSRGNPELMKTWVNTFLGETWEESGKRVEWSDLLTQRETYEHPVPDGVTMLTAGVDTQDDRFEIEIVGWGDDHRSWSVAYHVIYGDLSTPAPWQELREYLKQTWTHPRLGDMPLRMTCMDSGGHYTQSVYEFTSSMSRVAAIRGMGGEGKPMIGRPTKNNLGGTQVFTLGVDTIKELVTSRLRSTPDQAGYCTFPHDRDDNYFRGLTAEELRTRFVKGFKKNEWFKIRPRNEPFDCRVYATAALEMLSVDLNALRRAALREALKRDIEKLMPKAKPTQVSRQPKSNWAHGWKND